MNTEPHTIPPSLEEGGRILLPWLREMRAEHPVWRDAYGIWHVFRYADVHRAISEPHVLSSDTARILPAAQRFRAGNLLQTDPPRHRDVPAPRANRCMGCGCPGFLRHPGNQGRSLLPPTRRRGPALP